MNAAPAPWYKELNRYHWFVFVVAALGWAFDTMDQQLFVLARLPALQELEGKDNPQLQSFSGYCTSMFLIGWATGGIAFGILGDRWGRAKTMFWTILVYSVFTGLSALAQNWWQFALFRFLTGLGVGGEFAVGIALVAEVMPERARPMALALLQALSAVGNISAALISLAFGELERGQYVSSGWRWMFVVGALPALLVVLIRRRLKEPERWQARRGVGRQLGSYGELFGNELWRRHAITGLLMSFSGVVGLWAVGFFSPDLSRIVFNRQFEQEARDANQAEDDRKLVRLLIGKSELLDKIGALAPSHILGLSADPESGQKDGESLLKAALALHKAGQTVTIDACLDEIDAARAIDNQKPQNAAERDRQRAYLQGALPEADELEPLLKQVGDRVGNIRVRLTRWAAINQIMFNLGAFFGIYSFGWLSQWTGRRAAFAGAYLAATASTAWVFLTLQEPNEVLWKTPLMGFCQLSLFGGFAIYLPELFPTHLRSTGTSFCYNVGRFVAAVGPVALAKLSDIFQREGYAEPMRPAAVVMCMVFVLGLLVLPFAPETKGKPLPE